LLDQERAALRRHLDQAAAARDIALVGRLLHTGRRGHEVRQPSITSAWERGSRASHSSRSQINGVSVSITRSVRLAGRDRQYIIAAGSIFAGYVSRGARR